MNLYSAVITHEYNSGHIESTETGIIDTEDEFRKLARREYRDSYLPEYEIVKTKLELIKFTYRGARTEECHGFHEFTEYDEDLIFEVRFELKDGKVEVFNIIYYRQ